jgi:hypothetical protein
VQAILEEFRNRVIVRNVSAADYSRIARGSAEVDIMIDAQDKALYSKEVGLATSNLPRRDRVY